MHTELAWLKAIAPDLMGVVTKRYQVLQFINWWHQLVDEL